MVRINRFEKARLISARVLQISLGAPIFVKVPKDTPIFDIAKEEFLQKALPLAIMRKMPSGLVQKVDVF